MSVEPADEVLPETPRERRMRHKRGEFTEAELTQQAIWETDATEHRASELARSVVLPEIDPAGEALGDFIQRAIVENPDFAQAAASCRRQNPYIEVRLPAAFVPGLLSARLMAKSHPALAAFRGDLAQPQNAKVLDAFWTGKLPLALRMAPAENPILDTADENARSNPVFQERLWVARIAVQRRDNLAMQLLERLRGGAYVARGFLAGDAARNEIPVPAVRWNDKAMQCLWRENELGPRELAPDGAPHYRGLRLFVATPATQTLPKTNPRKPHQQIVDDWLAEHYRNAHDGGLPVPKPSFLLANT